MASAIGLLGGSFDPVHAGHLQLARDALRALPVSEVRFLPAAQPWQKARIDRRRSSHAHAAAGDCRRTALCARRA
jgi:cytidyltransferase-like protein